MTSERVSYTESDQSFDAVVVRPDREGPQPAVLVFHAWGGRSDFEEARAAALAELGYVGVGVDLYGVGKRGHDMESNRALMMPLVENPPELRRRITAAYETAAALDGVDSDRLGAIGYCFGGTCAILAARMGLALRGAVSFHGLLKIGEPLDAEVRAKILVLHGQDDPMVPPKDIGAFAEEMNRIDADWQLHAYPGVVHAFTNPAADNAAFGTVYNEDADRRSWREMTAFFADVLGS